METGAIFLFIVVVFCVFLGFVTATAIVYRKQVKELKRLATVNSNLIHDMSKEIRQNAETVKEPVMQVQPEIDVASLMDQEGISALVDAMAKAGK